MKKLLLVGALLLASFTTVSAQDTKIGPYEFKVVKENKHTEVRDQHRTGTCWAFASLGLIEAEVIRLGHAPVDLSEMWIVRNAYYEKVVKYIRMHGKIQLSQGGNAHDTFMMIEKYGLIPESAYHGNEYGTTDEGHVHGELSTILISFANAIIKNPNRGLTTAWENALNNILDAYFGARPDNFMYEGKEYTPETFASALKIKGSNYITLTSYTHHAFYTPFVIEIPDNWAWGASYNVPMNEFTQSSIDALKSGYTVCWDADVSDKGFKHGKGLALYPETDVKEMANSERSRWGQMSDQEVTKSIFDFENVVEEKVITQELRQNLFNNYNVTDDHLMLFTGLYQDQNGKNFFKVKNSWNTDNSVGNGYLWCSVPFYEVATISISLHKDAISSELRNKLNIK